MLKSIRQHSELIRNEYIYCSWVNGNIVMIIVFSKEQINGYNLQAVLACGIYPQT